MGSAHRWPALSWLPALLVAISACGGTRIPSQGALSPTPSAAASPIATTSPVAVKPLPQDYGQPPAGVDLLYVTVPGWPTHLVGYDWQGNPRATVHLTELDGYAHTTPEGISVAPNGQGFESGAYTFDRLGRVIYQHDPSIKGFTIRTWSEDGAILCGVEEVHPTSNSDGSGTTDYYLVRRAVSGPPVRVVRFLHLDAIPGDMGYYSVACSHRLDRALLVQTVCCSIASAMAIGISDGRILGTWHPATAGWPVFSPDGQLAAEPSSVSGGTTLVSTVVRTVLGGTVLARYGKGITFKALSGNNQFAIVSGDGSGGSQTRVIEVTTARQVWQDGSNRGLRAVWARPGSGDIALAFPASTAQIPCPSQQSGMCADPESDVVIVHADGSFVALEGVFELPWPVLP